MQMNIEFDESRNNIHIQEDSETIEDLNRGCVLVVGAMARITREMYGSAGLEALMQTIRNMDDASAFNIMAMSGDEEDGDADEKKQAAADVDRSGGACTC